MNTLFTLLRKEFRQIFRNKFMLPVIFVIPIVQMVILVYAASLDMKNIDMVVVDHDRSMASRRLISKFAGSPFFTLKGTTFEYKEAERMIIRDQADVVLRIEKGFEADLYSESQTECQLIINAINATEAGLINAYSGRIISDFNLAIRTEWFGINRDGMMLKIDISTAYWFNPLMDYKIYMFSGILVIVVTMIGMLLTALNLVREKELGTAEQMNVTPMKKYQFIVAKLLPFWIIAMFELSFGLVLGHLLFNLPVEGSLLLLFGFASVYVIVVLSIGLFFSTFSSTQQQLMFVAFFFMITFILMSGVFTPQESMPVWAQKLNVINPVAYFMRVIRMVLLKGSGIADIGRDLAGISIYAVLILTLAITNYRKTAT
ncbi:MAG: ABC transporter permease [Bacteroidales bacterium]